MSAEPLDALVREHLGALETLGYSSSTVRSRRCNLRHFHTWCEGRGINEAHEITLPVLERYRTSLYHARQKNGQPLGWGAQAQKLVAIKGLLKWLTRTHRLSCNPAADLELPRQPRHLPGAVLTAQESERVLAQPDIRHVLGLRDRALLEVLYSTGIRRSELVHLKLTDLDPSRGTLFIREGKGKRDRMVPIGERAIRWILAYLDQARPQLLTPPDRGVLFLTRRGRRMRLAHMSELVRRYIEGSGIGKKGSCHPFRHTMATLLLEGGADIRDIQEMLGHAQLSTTQLYTRVSIARLKRVHERAHPARLPRTQSSAVHDELSPLAADGRTGMQAEESAERPADRREG